MPKALSASQINALILVALALTWGSSFILMKEGLKSYSYFQVGAFRILISALCLSPLYVYAFKRVKKKDLLTIWIAGITGSGLPPFLFTYAQTHIDSTVAGILNSTVPLFTILIALIVFRQKVSWKKWLGIGIGFLGTVLIVIATRLYNIMEKQELDSIIEASNVLMEVGIIGKGDAFYSLFILLATFCYATSVNIVKSRLQNVHTFTLSPLTFLFNVLPALAILIYNTESLSALIPTNAQEIRSISAIAILAGLGTAAATTLYFRLTQRTNAMYASMVTYLMPVISIFWGILDNEAVGILHVLGLGVILIGVYLVTRPIQEKYKVK